jgi:hypothetical protein
LPKTASGPVSRRGLRAEELIAELFRQLGYEVVPNVRIRGIEVDFLINCEGLRSPVEISAPSSSRTNLGKIRTDAARLQVLVEAEPDIGSPILVTLSRLTDSAREWAQNEFDLRIWDLDTILEKARPFSNLYRSLTKISAEVPNYDNETLSSSTVTEHEVLIRELEDHIRANTISPSEYESLCMRVFAHVFDPDLYGFKTQARTSDNANRYDFICRIKSGNPFWDSIRSDFRTKAILFECKNYDDLITADEIYSTERYLYAGGLRTVCFLISRLGPNKGCIGAAQGAMREAGKLILLLSNKDMIELIKLKSQENGAESYLDERIWNFVISLPR